MSVDVELLIRDYAEHIDSSSTPVDIDSLLDERPTLIQAVTTMKPSLARSAGVGVAAFVIVLVVGAVLLFITIGSERPVATWSADPSSSLSWSRIPYDEAAFGEGFEQVMDGVTVGGPGLVAVGQAGFADGGAAVWTSVDGLSWSRVPHNDAVFGGGVMHSVTAGGPGLVAVGTSDQAAVWTSPDGFNWSRVPDNEAVFGGGESVDYTAMQSVTAGGPGLVAVGIDGHPHGENANAVVWTSPDGLVWSRVPHDEAVFGGGLVEMRSVTAGGPGLVAVGGAWPGVEGQEGGAAVWTSPDGIIWSRVPDNEAVFGGGMNSVAAGGPGLVAVGWDAIGAAVWTSPDGITWSRVPRDEAVFGGAEMSSVTVGGSGLVAVGWDSMGAVAWTSPDGFIWSRVPRDEAVFGTQKPGLPDLEMRSITAGGSHLVAVGANKVPDTYGPTESDAAVWVATPGD